MLVRSQPGAPAIRQALHALAEDRGRAAEVDAGAHVHHIIPLSKLGTNEDANLVTLCYQCHNRQHKGFRVTRQRSARSVRATPGSSRALACRVDVGPIPSQQSLTPAPRVSGLSRAMRSLSKSVFDYRAASAGTPGPWTLHGKTTLTSESRRTEPRKLAMRSGTSVPDDSIPGCARIVGACHACWSARGSALPHRVWWAAQAP